MPENNFEKKVQQRMDELKLQPAATVWENVFEKIRKEKKRRRFILWFFLFALLLLGGGGWWYFNNNNNNDKDISVTRKPIENREEENRPNKEEENKPSDPEDINADPGVSRQQNEETVTEKQTKIHETENFKTKRGPI